jgi:hypothetical protein
MKRLREVLRASAWMGCMWGERERGARERGGKAVE